MHKKDLEGLEIRQRVNQLVVEEDNLVLKKTALALEHKAEVERLRGCHESYLEADIRLAEARSDVASLTERNKGIKVVVICRLLYVPTGLDMTFPKLLNRRFPTSGSKPRVYPKMRLCFRMYQVPHFGRRECDIYRFDTFLQMKSDGCACRSRAFGFESLPVV